MDTTILKRDAALRKVSASHFAHVGQPTRFRRRSVELGEVHRSHRAATGRGLVTGDSGGRGAIGRVGLPLGRIRFRFGIVEDGRFCVGVRAATSALATVASFRGVGFGLGRWSDGRCQNNGGNHGGRLVGGSNDGDDQPLQRMTQGILTRRYHGSFGSKGCFERGSERGDCPRVRQAKLGLDGPVQTIPRRPLLRRGRLLRGRMRLARQERGGCCDPAFMMTRVAGSGR